MKAIPESRRCKRACCWTPFSCGRKYTCTCHAPVSGPPPKLTLESLLTALDDE